MSKNFRRSAVALVLAATMVLSSQGVLTAFADTTPSAEVSAESAYKQIVDEGNDDELTIGQSDENENQNENSSPSTSTADNSAAVVEQINSLPTTDDLANYTPTIELKPEDEGYQEAYQAALDAYYSQVQEQVKAARAAYDALTEEEKAAFDATILAKLESLENLFAMREQTELLPETRTGSWPNGPYPSESPIADYSKQQSDSVSFDRYEEVDGVYTLYYTIHEDAPSNITLDLASKVAEVWSSTGKVLPGVTCKFKIVIKNESPNTYKYKNNSFVLAPPDRNEFGDEDAAFLPALTYDGQLLPIASAGSIFLEYFYEEIFEVDGPADVSFEEICGTIYDRLAEHGYSGENAMTKYMLHYFSEKYNKNFQDLNEVFIEDPNAWATSGSHNGIYSMSEDELKRIISLYPAVDRFIYATPNRYGGLNVQIKWPEEELAVLSYNTFYQNLFSIVYGEQNVRYLKPTESGDLEFSRSHGLGDYLDTTNLYEETNQYFTALTESGFKTGDSLEIWLGYGLDGPTSNSYQNFSFGVYNIIELEQPTVPTPDPDPDPDPDPTPDPDPQPNPRPDRDDDDDWEPLPDAPVKDKPEKVEVETEVPEETETPAPEQPEKHNPETGDTTTAFAAMALAAVSLGGVVLLGRKKK